ncbi:ferric uptake regulator family protein [Bordetella genomosp. 8]|uniref:Ferric uptake regulator family protein n=1 Tax=Bordetella genomosp. 8 TaxID=1416806 RepID=A0A1W6YHT2_9BORD|nr:transcriptional repressor [Bordetella genomosp. 8]ARP80544.1 ferric uptake regulator family protein [Bordetella genomosp. 8]
MEPRDDSPRIVDLIAAFGSKKLPSGKHKIEHTAAAAPDTGSSLSFLEQRLVANKVRPTIARLSVLSTLEKAMPSCLDARQTYRILSTQFDSLTPGAIYRALNDLWIAGLLVRTEAARGRALYAIKPDALNARYDTLRCHCGGRLVFLDDLALRKHLQTLAREKGFALEAEPVFTISTTCEKCRSLRNVGQ